MTKPFSQACINNREPILQVLSDYFAEVKQVLEIGSGSGQHAVYFGAKLPHLTWQTSDQLAYHDGIKQWLAEADCANVLAPIELDVTQPWPQQTFAGIFSANTTHIMHWPMVEALFAGVGEHLAINGYFCLYGPFNFCGEFTSASNQAFDASLKQRDPQMGLRDYVDLEALARAAGLMFVEKHDMPANNFILVWQKALNKTLSFEL
ncbi:MAG: DUF938 domain-containing protein [Gammaproteobacteria bacterium]|nr:DUF938 domain-containing protein [Gammaproteobacteria bacterium]NVK86770.1 DUF938 domain-containing protein [Gammaproteobacteria bacterium]